MLVACILAGSCSFVVVQTRGNGDEPIHVEHEPPMKGCFRDLSPTPNP